MAAVRVWKSRVKRSSASAASRTVSRSWFNNSSDWLTRRWLLTILPDPVDQFVELIENRRRFVHAGEQIVEKFVFALAALGVLPGLFGRGPAHCQLLGRRHDHFSGAADAHEEPPKLFCPSP